MNDDLSDDERSAQVRSVLVKALGVLVVIGVLIFLEVRRRNAQTAYNFDVLPFPLFVVKLALLTIVIMYFAYLLACGLPVHQRQLADAGGVALVGEDARERLGGAELGVVGDDQLVVALDERHATSCE